MVNGMRTKIQISLIGILIISIVVLELIMTHMQQVNAALPWVLSGIGGIVGIVISYHLYKGYHSVRTMHLERKSRVQEIARANTDQDNRQAIEQRRLDVEFARIKAEERRMELEHERLMLAVQWQAQHVIVPEGHTAVFADQDRSFTKIQSPRLPALSARRVEQIDDEPNNLEIPSAPKFVEMCHLITTERAPLCYGIDGPLYGTVVDLLSMAVSGKPGRGKTTALMYYVAFLLKCGAEVWIFDPHGSMNALSALNGQVLENMPATAKVIYLDREQDMVNAVPVLMTELVARDEYYRPAHETKHPLLVLADELPVLAEFDVDIIADWKADKDRPSKPLTFARLFKYFVLQARKWNCYFIGSGQTFDAETLPKKVTDSMNSRLVFFSSDMRARMSGLENDAIKNLLPAIRRAGPGVMIFDCSRFDAPVIGVIPELSIEDLMAFLGVRIVNALPNNVRPEIKPCDTPFVPRTQRYTDSQDTPDSIETIRITSALQSPVESHLEPTHTVTDERTYERAYTMDEATAERFAMAYELIGNIDQALQKAGSNTRYRTHAREIIKARGLKKEGTR